MGKKAVIAIVTLSIFLVLLAFGMQSFELARANPTWGLRPSTPSQDKPIIVIESPENYTYCGNGSVMLNFTVIKPSSWNWTLAPFGSCANGNIQSVNVSLNGIQVFQEYLSADKLNGGGNWNKSYSLSIDGLNSGLNSLSLIVLANAQYINSSVTVGDITTRTVGAVPMNVTDTLYLISGISSNSSANSILSSSSTEPFPSPTPPPNPTQPMISILYPQNNSVFNAYPVGINYVLLYQTNSTLSWVGYSLDGADNVTVAGNGTDVHDFDLSNYHSLTVYANDTSGIWATPQTVTFRVNHLLNDSTPTPPPSPTLQPTITPEPTMPKPEPYLPSPFPKGFVLLPAIALAAAIISLLYFRRKRSNHG